MSCLLEGTSSPPAGSDEAAGGARFSFQAQRLGQLFVIHGEDEAIHAGRDGLGARPATAAAATGWGAGITWAATGTAAGAAPGRSGR